MGVGLVTDEEKKNLEQFLVRRQAKQRMVDLLSQVKELNDLKRGEVTIAQSASYEKIVESIDEALKNDWLSHEQLEKVLSGCEIAGRQHVCVFRVRDEAPKPTGKGSNQGTSTGPLIIDQLADLLSSPKRRRTRSAQLEEFWNPPAKSFARVVEQTKDVIVTKLVTTRTYVTEEITLRAADHEMLKRAFHKERSALILKLDLKARILQIRVPPREHGSVETAKKIFDFCQEMLADHFGEGKLWELTQDIPVSDGFPKIVDNRTDFVMEQDTPENAETVSKITAKRGKNGKLNDLRDTSGWDHGEGYSRLSLRGAWTHGTISTFCHMNLDRIQVDKKTVRRICRLFIPQHCVDGEIDHVIGRILDHLG